MFDKLLLLWALSQLLLLWLLLLYSTQFCLSCYIILQKHSSAEAPAFVKNLQGPTLADRAAELRQRESGGSVIVNTKLAPEYAGENNSWDILWDPKYKGRIGVLAGAVDTIPLVAAHIGVNAYNMSDDEWEKVKVKLRELVVQARLITNVTGELEVLWHKAKLLLLKLGMIVTII